MVERAMGWAWLREVSGAGALAAPAAAFAEREIAVDPGHGAPALLALAHAIDAFATREASAQDEARFVEGAGALFGLVLLAHVGEGSHASRDGVHRVQLGRAGFFDPFAAIERALEEGPAKRVLVEATRAAEREARGEGPVARVAIAFEKALDALGDGRRVTARFDRALFVGEVQVDLTRTIEATAEESDATLARSVAKLLEMLPGGPGHAIDRREAEQRLLPRVVGPSFSVPGTLALASLADDLRVALVLAYDGRSRFVRPGDLDAWSLGADDARAIAAANLRSRARPPRFVRVASEHGPMLMTRTGDGLDSARLVLPEFLGELSAILGDPFLVAVPHRDVVIACADGERIERELRARAEDDSARAPHAISGRVYVSERAALRATARVSVVPSGD